MGPKILNGAVGVCTMYVRGCLTAGAIEGPKSRLFPLKHGVSKSCAG